MENVEVLALLKLELVLNVPSPVNVCMVYPAEEKDTSPPPALTAPA
jgi:hypothetical protein